jgi:predicted secreted acid phosphatase
MEEYVTKPTLHLVGIFHTIHNQAYSHCAFTGKALRFAKMLQQYGYSVIEYSNGGSESEADKKVVMLSADELADFTDAKKRNKENFHGDLAAVGTPWHDEFEKRLLPAITSRIEPGDIVCHPFGHAHSGVDSNRRRIPIQYPC